MSEAITCSQCKKEILSVHYVKCNNCKGNFHFATCSPLSEATYLSMSVKKKASWRCQICEPRSRSPNTLYQAFVFDEANNKKQARVDDDEEIIENDQSKKFKEDMSLTSINNKLCSFEADIKLEIKDVKSTMEKLINSSHVQLTNEIHNALTTITNTLSTLTDQVKELNEKGKQRDIQINLMEIRINDLEQQMISKNIEIKNVTNKQISPIDVVKKIGMSLNVNISEEDISRAHRLKKQENKIVVEFSTTSKKSEFMSKIVRHRVDANMINNSDDQNKYIYINDQLSFHNRRLLWLAKTKAKEANWKFAWVRNGHIFAKKNENSPLFTIKNNADIEVINNLM